jgi:hypothetical protein
MPRISANKLGQYVVCPSPARRRRIIQDQKYPSKAIVPMYRLAEEPLVDFFTGGGRDGAVIDRAVVGLRSNGSGTSWAISDRRNTADALDAVIALSPKLPFDGVNYVRGPEQAPCLHVKSVDVSVLPNFLLHFQHRGVACVGALKLHFPKSDDSALEREGGEYVSTLLQRWLIEHGPAGRKVMPSHCLSVDVFRRAVIPAPTANTRRMANIVAACEEIAAHWRQL